MPQHIFEYYHNGTLSSAPTSSSSLFGEHRDGMVESKISSLSDQQQIILCILSIISGSLSILGSSTIVYKNVSNWYQTTSYDRLLCGLSCFDIIASMTSAISPFLLDSNTSHRVWAIGNHITCEVILGFFTQLSFCAIAYNGLLSWYYLLMVRFRMKKNYFAKYVEPIMHFTTIAFFITTASIGSLKGYFSEIELGFGSWVKEYPRGCYVDDSCMSDTIGWIYGGIPTILTLFSIIANNIIIFFYVQQRISGGAASSARRTRPSSTRTISTTRTSSSSSLLLLPPISWSRNSNSVDSSCNQKTDIVKAEEGQTASLSNCTDVGDATSHQHPRSNSVSSTSSCSSSTTTAASAGSPRRQRKNGRTKGMSRQRRDAKGLRNRYINEVATQGFLYVGTFLLAYTSGFILRCLESNDMKNAQDEDSIYWLLILDAWLRPFQGFCNMFVYTRPNRTRLQLLYPDQPYCSILWWACFEANIPRLTNAYTNRRTTTKNSNSKKAVSFHNRARQRHERRRKSGTHEDAENSSSSGSSGIERRGINDRSNILGSDSSSIGSTSSHCRFLPSDVHQSYSDKDGTGSHEELMYSQYGGSSTTLDVVIEDSFEEDHYDALERFELSDHDDSEEKREEADEEKERERLETVVANAQRFQENDQRQRQNMPHTDGSSDDHVCIVMADDHYNDNLAFDANDETEDLYDHEHYDHKAVYVDQESEQSSS